MTEPGFKTEGIVPPACVPTVERLQLVLDGEALIDAIDADPHLAACAACRERVAAARLVSTVLASRSDRTVPGHLTDTILAAVSEARTATIRRKSFAISGGVALALAASVLLLVWAFKSNPEPIVPLGVKSAPETVKIPSVAPEPRPIRIGDEFSKVGQALRDTSKPITEPAASAPQVISLLTGSLKRPLRSVAEFEPAKSIADLPDAARIGFEPITATTQKAFARLMRDVGGVQVSTKPKS
jgi:anti-sigma factor RsiW